MSAISNTEYAKTLGMPPEYAAKAAAFADAKGLSLAAREVVATFKDAWVGRDGKRREPSLMLVVTAEALMALALKERNFAPVSTEFTDDGREWTDVWIGAAPPAACRVTFEVEGIERPVVVVHTWLEYTQGSATPTQQKMPATMLAKATRSLGVRQIAPGVAGGMLSEEEAHAVTAAADAEGEQVERVVEAVTPTQDAEAKGGKLSRAEQYAARKAELVAAGKALRDEFGADAAGELHGVIKARGADPEKLTAAHLKAILDAAGRIRSKFEARAEGAAEESLEAEALDAAFAEAAAEPDTASRGSHADAAAAWAGIGGQDAGASEEFVI